MFPCNKWEDYGSESLSYLPNITQLVSCKSFKPHPEAQSLWTADLPKALYSS